MNTALTDYKDNTEDVITFPHNGFAHYYLGGI